jgi:hypothetical protein
MAFSIPVSSTSHCDTRSEKNNDPETHKETLVSCGDHFSSESIKDERSIKKRCSEEPSLLGCLSENPDASSVFSATSKSDETLENNAQDEMNSQSDSPNRKDSVLSQKRKILTRRIETLSGPSSGHQGSSDQLIEMKKSSLDEKSSDQSKVPRTSESMKDSSAEIASKRSTLRSDSLKRPSTGCGHEPKSRESLDSNLSPNRRVSGRHSSLVKIKDEPGDPQSKISHDKPTSPKKMDLTNQSQSAKSPKTPKLLKPSTKNETSKKRVG